MFKPFVTKGYLLCQCVTPRWLDDLPKKKLRLAAQDAATIEKIRAVGSLSWEATGGGSTPTVVIWVCLKIGYIPNEIAI